MPLFPVFFLKKSIHTLKRRDLRTAFLLMVFAIGLGTYTGLQGGQYFWPDEYRYSIVHNIFHIYSHPDNYSLAYLIQFFKDSLRGPIFHMLSLFPAWCQYALSGFQIEEDTLSRWVIIPNHMWVPVICMAAIYSINSFLIHRISFGLFKSPTAANISQGLYILWLPHLMFTRHLLPYMPSETFLLLSVFVLVGALNRENTNAQKNGYWPYIHSGALWMLHFMTYLGYYATGPLLALSILIPKIPLNDRLKNMGWFCAPIVGLLGIGEFTSRLFTGSSYIQELLEISKYINQGDPSEGWHLPFDYGWAISPIFTSLALISVVYVLVKWTLSFKTQNKAHNTAGYIAALTVFLYLWMVCQSTLFQWMVLYGRLLLPFAGLLILLIGFVMAQWLCSERILRKASSGLVLCACFLSMGKSVLAFEQIHYFNHVNKAFEIETDTALKGFYYHSNRLADYQFHSQTLPKDGALVRLRTYSTNPGPSVPFSCKALEQIMPKGTLYVMLNREFTFPLNHYNGIGQELKNSGHTIYKASHPFMFIPYQYEGFSPKERQLLKKNQLQFAILKNPCR